MTSPLNERTRSIVAGTLKLMEQHRSPLEAALASYMARQEPHDPRPAEAQARAGAITAMLLDHAVQLGGEPSSGIPATVRRHRALAIGGKHYSTFGDALKPVMRDVLGSKANPSVLSAWGVAYWAIVRMLFAESRQLAA